MGKSKLALIMDSFDSIETPTQKQYISLQDAYDILNKKCFGDTLPPVLITFQRQKKSVGYYWHHKLISRQDNAKISEIALAINHFTGQPDKDIFSTLLHEMVHHWQFCFGKASRNGYHNREWAEKMKTVGLHPSDTGLVNGSETGQNMSHYIIDNGMFDTVFRDLTRARITIDYNSIEIDKEKKKAMNKIKYTCPECEANAWGKPELNIECGDCNVPMISQEEGE